MAKIAQNKTQATNESVDAFIKAIENEQQKKDASVILDLMKKATGEKPKVWTNAMIGFGEIVVTSPATGRQANWLRMGFSPRKTNLTLYLPGGMKSYEADLKKLGKHKVGGGCLYINKLEDIDMKVLGKMIQQAAKRS